MPWAGDERDRVAARPDRQPVGESRLAATARVARALERGRAGRAMDEVAEANLIDRPEVRR